jgi:hypothetical protein
VVAWRHSSLQSDSRTVPYRTAGTRRDGGSLKRCVSTLTRALSTRTPGTAITEASSSLRARIGQWVAAPTAAPTLTVRVLSFTGHGSPTVVTATPGVSGAPLRLVDSGDAWERANRAALHLVDEPEA